MTKEIWINIAINCIQLIALFVMTAWQVRTAREIANPAQKQVKPKEKFIGKRFKYHLKTDVPLVIFIGSALLSVNNYFVTPISKLSIFNLCFSLFLASIGIAFSFLSAISYHLLNASKCHMARLDKITDRPCADGKCPF
jgi:hypothetical protein